MSNKFGKFFNIMLLSFYILTLWNVSATPPQGNFTEEDINAVKLALSSKEITLDKFIANGGNGDVYEATQNNKKIAIKISKTDADVRIFEQLTQADVRYSGSEGAREWLEECCVLPKKVDAKIDKPIYVCSMPLAKCNLVKRTDKSNIKYDYLDIANIIKNIVKGFEALRIRGFCQNDLSLGNILKMSGTTHGSDFMLSDFGATQQVESESEGLKRISQDIKYLVEILNGPSFSRGNPRDASLEQREAAKSFKEFCKYIKGKTEISAVDVLNHPYITIYGGRQ